MKSPITHNTWSFLIGCNLLVWFTGGNVLGTRTASSTEYCMSRKKANFCHLCPMFDTPHTKSQHRLVYCQWPFVVSRSLPWMCPADNRNSHTSAWIGWWTNSTSPVQWVCHFPILGWWSFSKLLVSLMTHDSYEFGRLIAFHLDPSTSKIHQGLFHGWPRLWRQRGDHHRNFWVNHDYGPLIWDIPATTRRIRPIRTSMIFTRMLEFTVTWCLSDPAFLPCSMAILKHFGWSHFIHSIWQFHPFLPLSFSSS